MRFARRFVIWGVLGLLLAAVLAACQAQEPDLEATVGALNATIAAQNQELGTMEAQAREPTPSQLPSPTKVATLRRPVVVSTPRPVSTAHRPPTGTPSATPLPTVPPLPTASATATATPVPDAAVGRSLTNLRSGPGVGYEILAEVESRTPLEVLGKSPSEEWIKVLTPAGLEGWMFLLPLELNIPLDSIPVTD